MKRKICFILASVFLVAGIGLLLFPPVSNTIGKVKSNTAADALDNLKNSTTDSFVTDDGEKITSAKGAIDASCVDGSGRPVTPQGEPVLFTEDVERLKGDSIAYNEWLRSHQGEYETTQYENAVFLLED